MTENQYILIKQWGTKRSVVDFISLSDDPRKTKRNILLDNEQLMNFQDFGLVIN